jgi:glycine betaine/choline ABC-type transport system substrate-binding protein
VRVAQKIKKEIPQMSGTLNTWKLIVKIAKEKNLQTMGDVEDYFKKNPNAIKENKNG